MRDMRRVPPGLLARLAGDPSIRVLVLAGAGGRAFCAGNDVSEFDAIRAASEAAPGRTLRSSGTTPSTTKRLPERSLPAETCSAPDILFLLQGSMSVIVRSQWPRQSRVAVASRERNRPSPPFGAPEWRRVEPAVGSVFGDPPASGMAERRTAARQPGFAAAKRPSWVRPP
jgi:hypothetical protein